MVKPVKIAIVAPANRLEPEAAERVRALAQSRYADRAILAFHPQCFLSAGHFAGDDKVRSDAFLEVANDPEVDAVWFARGGYGSCRIADSVFGELSRAAHLKTYLGYSDIGFLLARLSREGVGRPVHGPMVADINRDGGAAAVERALDFLVLGETGGVEPRVRASRGAFAFNLTALSLIVGAPTEPDFTGAQILLEDVDEHHYRIDRMMYRITASPNVRNSAGLRLGRFSRIPDNDPPFEKTVREIFDYWCARAGVPFLGEADIGHDAANKIVPFPVKSAFA